jgi:modification methylase
LKTNHRIVYDDSRDIKGADPASINLMLTSPPYPMIEMWDELFSKQNKEIELAIKRSKGDVAFELMHTELDKIWKNVYSLLCAGGIACINIGDATRTLGDSFELYTNHARILSYCRSLGFRALPEILWRKQSNKPNKFMGSGMLPPGAYVTQEHEYILILRKNQKRGFHNTMQKLTRQRSAFFWEERNAWFSDIWDDLKGDKQELKDSLTRARSAAFPFELCYRIISMFSVHGDTVLDPFAGTGTTTLASMATGRNSIGIEMDQGFKNLMEARFMNAVDLSKAYSERRIQRHLEFVSRMKEEGRQLRYTNKRYGFPVMTSQEVELRIPIAQEVKRIRDDVFEVTYSE